MDYGNTNTPTPGTPPVQPTSAPTYGGMPTGMPVTDPAAQVPPMGAPADGGMPTGMPVEPTSAPTDAPIVPPVAPVV